MNKPLSSSFLRAASLICILLLGACTPKYDWREVRGSGAPYVIVMPAKPASHARPVNLDGTQVTMTMTAAEVDGTSFAVGTAELPDAAEAQKAVQAMKTAMVRNINGKITHEQPVADNGLSGVEVEATGAAAPGGSKKLHVLQARFVAKGRRVYQLVILGTGTPVPAEAADTFFTSFKPD